jgi:catecholate siderophore receptor
MKFRLRPIAAAVLAIQALPVAAQQTTEPSPSSEPSKEQATQLREVKVEATVESPYKADTVASPKFTQPLRDTPQTIQVITKELFNQQGATTLTEALRNSPAVGAFYAGENGNTSTGDTIYMRGFDASNSIFVDGVRDLGSVSHDLFNIDAVEVEKGPAGTDNGRTSPSGAINMVSKQANLENAISGTITTGTDSQNRATADLNQKLNGIDGAALRMNAVWQDSDVAGRDHVNNSRTGIAPSLGFGLNSDTRAWVNLLYVKQDNIPDAFVPTIGLPGWKTQLAGAAGTTDLTPLDGHPVDSENFYGTRYDHDDGTSKMATLRVEHDFSDKLKLQNIARWGATAQDTLLTSFMGTNANIKTTNPNDPGDLSAYTLARNLTTKDQTNKILTDQFNLRYDFATGIVKHSLSTGVEFTREELFSNTVTASGAAPASLYDPDWSNASTITLTRNGAGSYGKTDTESVYAFDTLKFLDDKLLVIGGVRFDHYKTEYNASAACTTAGTGVNSGRTIYCGSEAIGTVVDSADLDDSDTLFNWKLGVVYKPITVASIYADYAVAQQPPGGANFQLAAASSAITANSVNADPQEAKTAEVGAKWDVINEALSLNLALFRTEVTNEIDNSDPNNITQTGEKRVQGVELSAIGNITDKLAISAGYTFQKTKVQDGPKVAADGTPNLTYSPEQAFTSWLTYQLPRGFTVGGGARYVDGLHKGTDGADTANGGSTPSSTASYTVWDAVASYAIDDHFTLRANGYNLFDKEYIAAINKSGYRYSPGMPRTFLFSVDYRF